MPILGATRPVTSDSYPTRPGGRRGQYRNRPTGPASRSRARSPRVTAPIAWTHGSASPFEHLVRCLARSGTVTAADLRPTPRPARALGTGCPESCRGEPHSGRTRHSEIFPRKWRIRGADCVALLWRMTRRSIAEEGARASSWFEGRATGPCVVGTRDGGASVNPETIPLSETGVEP